MERPSFPRAGAWPRPRSPARLCLPGLDPEFAVRLSRPSVSPRPPGTRRCRGATFSDETLPHLPSPQG